MVSDHDAAPSLTFTLRTCQMIDTDLLLLPAMSHYFLDLPQGQGRAEQFFAQNATLQNGTYGEILNRY